MAIFGAPVTRPDDTQRAVDGALEIRRRIEGLGPALAARGLPHPDIDRSQHLDRDRRQHRLALAPQLHGAGRRREPRLAHEG